MFAIFVTGGKQYKVAEGDVIFVEKLGVAEGEKVTFDKVLCVSGEALSVGAPYVAGATVVIKISPQSFRSGSWYNPDDDRFSSFRSSSTYT